MPSKPLKPCNKVGCHNLTRDRYCDDHKQLHYQYDKHRGTAAKRGYGARWRRARATYLMQHPICVKCGSIANVVDHIIPHRGDMHLFWDVNNWQSLCDSCHSIKTAREDGGFGNKMKNK